MLCKAIGCELYQIWASPCSTLGGPYASKAHPLALALTLHLLKNIALIGHSSS